MFNPIFIRDSVRRFLNEDLHLCDMSTPDVFHMRMEAKGYFVAKEKGIIAGTVFAPYFYEEIAPVDLHWYKKDGEEVLPGDIVGWVKGPAYALIMVERTYLNLLQRLSGIATATRTFVDQLPDGFTLLDTRKTTPGLRLFEKYASWKGGATNHRYTLMDAVMIKDNHIKIFGSIREAVENVKKNIPYTMKLEVECETVDMVKEALSLGVDIIMLDNMDDDEILQSIDIIREISPNTTIEISGGITIDRIKNLSAKGVKDVYISTSRTITRSSWLDISFDIE